MWLPSVSVVMTALWCFYDMMAQEYIIQRKAVYKTQKKVSDMSEVLFSYRDVEYIGNGILLVPKGLATSVRKREYNDSHDAVPVTEAHRIYPLDVPTEEDEWWLHAVEQAQFLETNITYPVMMRLPEDNTYCIAGRHVESFVDWLRDVPSDGVVFDRFMRGHIITNPEWSTETNQAMSIAEVIVTPYASSWISPVTEQSLILAEDAQKATQEGFCEPDKKLFPTSRTLMPHQLPVSQVLAWRGYGILADDVGSGKSSMFINGFFILGQHLYTTGYYEDLSSMWPLVIVTKKTLVEPTAREAQLWFTGVKVQVASGNKPKDIDEDTNIIICPATSLKSQLPGILRANPKGVVFDEAHMFKNPAAARSQAALALSDHIRENNEHPYRVCATATPMQNRPKELYTLLQLTGMDDPIIGEIEEREQAKNGGFPKFVKVRNPRSENYWNKPFDNQMKFEKYFCGGESGFFGWEANGATHEEELHEILRDNGMIRRRKSEFMTPLPPLRQKFIYCTISEEDQKVYDRAQDEFRDHIVLKLREQAKKEKWSQNRLRQEIQDKLMKANSAEAIMKMSELRQIVALMKIESTVDWINRYLAGDPLVVGSNPHHTKLIVFSHHKESQRQLVEHPALQKHGVLYIGAGTKRVNDIIDQFQDPDSGKNLLVLYSNATDGLTLTAAHAVFVLEIPFVPSVLIQMAGRCWARYSELYEPHGATLYLSTSNTGIDKYLENMVREKSILSKTIIDGEKAISTLNDMDSEEVEQYDSTGDILKALLKKK